MTACGKKPSGQGILYTIPSTQSTFMCAQARGVEYDHADCAALQVAAACLSATNSFLWNGKRESWLFRCCSDRVLNVAAYERSQLVVVLVSATARALTSMSTWFKSHFS